MACSEIALSFSNVFCFYVSQSRIAVQIMNFLNDEVSMKQIDLQTIGKSYKIIEDNDEFAILSFIHSSETSIGLLKLFKKDNNYKIMLLTPADFFLPNMYVQHIFTLYKTNEEILTIFFINRNANSLVLHRMKLDMENFTKTTLKTINDIINLNPISKFIWKIQCRNQMYFFYFFNHLVLKEFLIVFFFPITIFMIYK